MIIDQLPGISTVQETDEIPVERGTTTYKSTLQKLKDLVASLLTKSDVGLGNVDNVRQYSAQNPPPYPVTSVNGDTGAVTTPQNDSGTGYCKMPDGTLIQWGTVTVPSGSYIASITFAKVFANTNYAVTLGIYDDIAPSINTKSTGGCRIGRTPNTASNNIEWQAIGRWK